jgi:AAA+ ATPase superfamily predicted ATPase
MKKIIGRNKELDILNTIWNAKEAVFASIYGRRRVGKTFLIRNFFQNKGIYLEITGTKDGTIYDQLTNFIESFTNTFYPNLSLRTPTTWRQAFKLLTQKITEFPKSKKIIIFLDELPWLATKRSRFIQNLDYFWNRHWSQLANVKLIVCGSAASWMLDNLINAKGGLYNRITNILLLQPFTLSETKMFFTSNNIKLSEKQIVDIYMIMGGIPYYLNQIKKSKSVIQNINDLCFQPDGLLYNEFPRLFKSLFDSHEIHSKIVQVIAKNRYGIQFKELAKKVGKSSGGRFRKRLAELEAAGFVQKFVPYGKKTRDHYYRIIDEYTMFYLHWIKPAIETEINLDNNNYWQITSQTPNWQSWAGYAFESLCYKHINKIRLALGLDKIPCKIGSWRYIPKPGTKQRGAQIDLLFDRRDDVITLCEIKYSINKFSIDKDYASILANKIKIFTNHFKTNKQITMAMITTMGLKKSIWTEDLITNEVTLSDLF